MDEGQLNTLYYPSAGEDFRPLLYSKKECLDYLGIDMTNDYSEPELFIFSDYCCDPRSTLFDTYNLHADAHISITIEDFCEIKPNPDYFDYHINEEFIDLPTTSNTGKAIFYRVRITSSKFNKTYFKSCIYFFYENVNLLEELFLKNKYYIDAMVWKRDGIGMGGGNIYHDYLIPISDKTKTKSFYVWDRYFNDNKLNLCQSDFLIEKFPSEIKNIVQKIFN